MAYAGQSYGAAGGGSSSATTATTGSATIPDGARVLLFINVGDSTSATPSAVPSGFSLIASAVNSNANNGKLGKLMVYEKKVAASEASTYTVTFATAFDFDVTAVWATGRHATAAATVSALDNQASSGTLPISIAAAGITAAANDDIFAFYGADGNGYSGVWSGTPPSGYTERNEGNCGAGAFGSYIATLNAASAGATGTLTAAMTSTTLTGADATAIIISLPVAAGGLNATLKSESKLTNVLSTAIPLATSLNSVTKLVSALAATSVFATLLAAKPTITPTLATAFNLQTSLQAVAKLPNALTNWTTVTLAGTLFNGNGSAISPYLWTTGPAPTAGTTLYYDSTYITIYSDASTSSSVGTAVTLIQWFDGTQWWSAELAYTPGEVTFLGAKSSLVNDLTTINSMSSSFNSSPRLINNLNTTISLASLNKSIASLPNALDSGITFASALNSTSSLPNALSTSIAAQTLLASKASIAGSFSLLMNATLSSASKLTNNLSTSIPLLTSFNGYSSMTSAFALPDMALQSVLRIAVSMPNELGTGIALQTNEVSTSRLTAAMSSGIPLATVLNSTLGFSSTLGGAPAVFQTALVAKAALLSDLYAYKAITTTLVSSGTVVSSLGTTLALQCEFSSTSSLLNDLIVLPVELPPAWRCVSIGSATHDAINGQALPDKDPEDVLDYGIILSDEATELDPLKVLTVSIESCSPDESPVSLVIDNALWAMSNPTSGVVDSIVFWLSGGTVGTTYVLRIEADDTETVPHIRVLVRRVTITVAKQ